MLTGSRLVLCFVIMLTGAGAALAQAQGSSWDFGVSGAAVQYDLSGTGTAPGLAVRAAREVAPGVVLEVRGLFAKPDQQFGPSTFFAPDVQLQYRWNITRLSPFVGGGAGLAANTRPLHTDWDPTLSVAAGTGVRLTRRMDLVGEFRLRGIEWRFTGTTAEWSAGLSWRLPGF